MKNKKMTERDTNGPSANELFLAGMLQMCHQLYVDEKTGVFMYLVDVLEVNIKYRIYSLCFRT